MNYEIKTLPSGIIIENRPNKYEVYCWFIKGTDCIHNEGEPAIENRNGGRFWYQHGKYHRLDGQAAEYAGGGYKDYYINNVSYEEEDYWNHPDVLAFKYLKEHPELKAFV